MDSNIHQRVTILNYGAIDEQWSPILLHFRKLPSPIILKIFKNLSSIDNMNISWI